MAVTDVTGWHPFQPDSTMSASSKLNASCRCSINLTNYIANVNYRRGAISISLFGLYAGQSSTAWERLKSS